MQSITAANAGLWQKIEHVRVGMLTTVGSDRQLTSRPMTSQKVDQDGLLWFFTSDQAAVAGQIESNPAVNVAFAAPDDSLYVSVSGNASIVKDRQIIEAMWNPFVQAWFPGGPQDPHVALIKVSVTAAEYWDSDKSKMTQLLDMAKAAISGKPPTSIGEHKKIDL
jgi:general stress protein 26